MSIVSFVRTIRETACNSSSEKSNSYFYLLDEFHTLTSSQLNRLRPKNLLVPSQIQFSQSHPHESAGSNTLWPTCQTPSAAERDTEALAPNTSEFSSLRRFVLSSFQTVRTELSCVTKFKSTRPGHNLLPAYCYCRQEVSRFSTGSLSAARLRSLSTFFRTSGKAFLHRPTGATVLEEDDKKESSRDKRRLRTKR